MSRAKANDPGAIASGRAQRSTIDRIALQSDAANTYVKESPEVAELESAFLDAVRQGMTGVTKALAGDRDEANFRAEWRGDRNPVTVRESCRVIAMGPDGRKSIARGLAVLARECGYALTPIDAVAETPAEALAELIEAERALDADAVRAVAGKVDAEAVARLEADIARDEEKLEKLRASLHASLRIVGGGK